MLTPQSHLKAWLKFASDPALHDQALAGARALDHRTADAVDMLTADEYTAQALMAYFARARSRRNGAAACGSPQRAVPRTRAGVSPHRQRPRPYDQLIERLGGGDPFAALKWLAAHGCDADPELTQAEDLVRAYQDSPRRSAMLATLAQAHRKP